MIGKALYTLLKANTAFDGIYVSPLRTFEGLQMPAITYMVLSVEPSEIKKGVSPLDEVSFTIDVFSKEYGQVEALGESVRSTFDRFCGVVGLISLQSIEFAGYNFGFDEGAEVYGVSLDFIARVDRTYDAGIYDYTSADYSALDYFVNT